MSNSNPKVARQAILANLEVVRIAKTPLLRRIWSKMGPD
jgi:hypothetical protein